MKKITEFILNKMLKNGLLTSSDNLDMEFEVPSNSLGLESKNNETIKIRIRADNVRINVTK